MVEKNIMKPNLIQGKKLVTLCITIPTYNRANLLKSLLDDLLQIKQNDIRFLVLDNNSTDKTEEILNEYKDSRLITIKNKETIPGNKNYIKAITSKDNGKYNLLILDRDKINVLVLKNLLQTLRTTKQFSVGRIFYHPYKDRVKLKFSRNNSLEEFMKILRLYHFNHPTGYLFSNNFLYDNTSNLLNLFDSNNQLVYPIEKFILDSIKNYPALSIGYSYKYVIDTTEQMGKLISGALTNYKGNIGVEIDYYYFEIKYMLIKIQTIRSRLIRLNILIELYNHNLKRFTLAAKREYANINYANHYGVSIKHLSVKDLNDRLTRYNNLFRLDVNQNFDLLDYVFFVILSSIYNIKIKLEVLVPFTKFLTINPLRYYRWILKLINTKN